MHRYPLVLAAILAATPLSAQQPDATLERDLSVFPPALAVEHWAGLANDHYWYVEDRRHLNADRPWYKDYVYLAYERAECWNWLWFAQDETSPPETRLVYLDALRWYLPEGWYESGRMPCPMPVMDDPNWWRNEP